jgi:uncharacterized protein (TIGR02147 family)
MKSLTEKFPVIFEYSNFRQFLDDYQRRRFCVDPEFSRTKLCERLGLPKSRSYFNDVIKGRKVTATYVERFIEVLEFSKEEAQFFRVLVKFNQAENADERELYFEQLVSLNRSPKKLLPSEVYQFYKEWHHSTIRSILDVYDFDGDCKQLARLVFPTISAKKTRESVELLKRLGLIAPDNRGFYKPTEKMITTGSYATDELVRQYQLQCLDLARTAIVKRSGLPHNVSTKLISISQEGYKRIEKRLHKFIGEISSIVHKDQALPDRVYHLDVQLYPNSNLQKNGS